MIKIMLFLKVTVQSDDRHLLYPNYIQSSQHPHHVQTFSNAVIILTGRTSYVFIIAQLLFMTTHKEILVR